MALPLFTFQEVQASEGPGKKGADRSLFSKNELTEIYGLSERLVSEKRKLPGGGYEISVVFRQKGTLATKDGSDLGIHVRTYYVSADKTRANLTGGFTLINNRYEKYSFEDGKIVSRKVDNKPDYRDFFQWTD